MHKEIYYFGEIEIEVTFDELHYQHLESIDHSQIYECRGFDSEGNLYSGIAEFCCDELISIEDIECIENVEMKKMHELYKAEVRAGIYNPKKPYETLEEKQLKGYNLKYHGIDYEV